MPDLPRRRRLTPGRRQDGISKWDRPPEPRDWRFFVGTLGRVLISVGILMFGFVAYQLWGTGLETARAQNSLGDRFEAAVSGGTDPITSGPPVTIAPGTSEPVTSEPDLTGSSTPTTAPPLAATDGTDLTALAVDQDIPDIIPGEAFARLELPKIGKDLYVVPGVGVEDLKKGPGHYPDSPLPGQLGNSSIAGHRTTFGEPFIDIDRLEPGDQMIVTMITGDRFVYEVTGTQIVSASDYWVVTTTDPTVAELTLTSCHPKYSARDRIVVKGLLVPELSDPVGVAEFYDLDPEDLDTDEPDTDEPDTDEPVIPGDDPTLEPPDADDVPATTSPANDDTNDDTAGAAATPPVDDDADQGPTETGAADAFARGWFDDRDAWPQIAMWGSALTAISLLAYWVSRRTRHDSIGFAVGIAPFLISLYFFFQNVNRLLPPGL